MTDAMDGMSADDLSGTLKMIGAIDISYSKTNEQKGIAYIAVFSYPNMKIVYEDYSTNLDIESPYIPGFLAFKEIKSYEPLFAKLHGTEFWPQVILVDGNGLLHTREFGCACHIGVQFDIPTIGVAKTTFNVDGLTREKVEALCQANLHVKHDTAELVGESGKVWGVALRNAASKIPVYVSIGHRVSLKTAV